MIALVPLGDRGWLAHFEREEDAARWAVAVTARDWPGVVDVVPAYHAVGIIADPDDIDLDDLAARLRRVEPENSLQQKAHLIRIPVCYDGEDLSEVADRLNLSVEQVIEFHSSSEYRVLRSLDSSPDFRMPVIYPPRSPVWRGGRHREARADGAVAIVGRQTAIYPAATPGGWHLIGRTPLTIVEMASNYFPIHAGDRLRFVPIERDEFEARAGERI